MNNSNKTAGKRRIKYPYYIFRISCLIVLITALFGCSYFTSRHRLDLSPYAENIIKITADIHYGLSQSQAVYLREYLDGPKVKNLEEYQDKVRGVVRSIIAYSIEVVTLGNTKMEDRERTKKLADYLDRLLRPVLKKPESNLDFTDAELDTVLINVRKQKNFLDALNAAQPLLDNIAATIGRFLDETTKIYNEALRKVRVVVIVWSEAHRKLAAGITDPAQIDLVGMVVNAAKNVVK